MAVAVAVAAPYGGWWSLSGHAARVGTQIIGDDLTAMVYMLTLACPVVLLALMLIMERVEQPLRRDAVGEQLVDFLDSARPEEVETFVSQGFAPALERYWRRRRSSLRRGQSSAAG